MIVQRPLNICVDHLVYSVKLNVICRCVANCFTVYMFVRPYSPYHDLISCFSNPYYDSPSDPFLRHYTKGNA